MALIRCKRPVSASCSDVDIDELSETLRMTSGVVSICGGGSKATWGAVGAAPDVSVDTAGLNGVVEYEPGDYVVTVLAGTPLADLQRIVGAAGQWLALDPPEADATVGGVVATNASGPQRLRYGTARELLIGVTMVLADGTVARSGGKVVKNVAGYDLGKLLVGSYGTLGVIASCTFRLHPLPRSVQVVSVATPEPDDAVRTLRRSPLRPNAIEFDGACLQVLVDGDAKRVVDLVGGDVGDPLPPSRPWTAGETALKVTHRVGALAHVLRDVRATVPQLRIAAHAASGVLWLGGDVEDPQQIEALRTKIAVYDGTVVVVDAPTTVKEAVDVWGPVRGLSVMRAVKEQFDPMHRLNRGRFVGGI